MTNLSYCNCVYIEYSRTKAIIKIFPEVVTFISSRQKETKQVEHDWRDNISGTPAAQRSQHDCLYQILKQATCKNCRPKIKFLYNTLNMSRHTIRFHRTVVEALSNEPLFLTPVEALTTPSLFSVILMSDFLC